MRISDWSSDVCSSDLMRRLLVSLWVLITAAFLMIHLVPGDPIRAAMGPNASAEVVAARRESLGLNNPLWQQYLDYIGGLFTGDLGGVDRVAAAGGAHDRAAPAGHRGAGRAGLPPGHAHRDPGRRCRRDRDPAGTGARAGVGLHPLPRFSRPTPGG